MNDTGHRGTSLRGAQVSQRDVLANRCPGWASGRGAAAPAGTPHTLQHHHYHPTPDTVPGYCGDTTLGLCSSLVNKTDGCREEERRKDRGQEDLLIFKVTIVQSMKRDDFYFFFGHCLFGNGGYNSRKKMNVKMKSK